MCTCKPEVPIYQVLQKRIQVKSLHSLFAEVVGAIVSVLIVWVLTGVLFYEAILRVINPELINVKANIMLITACVGVFVNVL